MKQKGTTQCYCHLKSLEVKTSEIFIWMKSLKKEFDTWGMCYIAFKICIRWIRFPMLYTPFYSNCFWNGILKLNFKKKTAKMKEMFTTEMKQKKFVDPK